MSRTDEMPFSPRRLTKSELDRNDIYMTAEPRTGRVVSLIGPLRLAQWLLLTFDRDCADCVERPRQLSLGGSTCIELDFWTRRRDDSEMFWFMVAESESTNGPTGRVHRDATLWSRAVQNAGVSLTLVYEKELLQRWQCIANYFRLLPNVQAAYQLPDILRLRGRVTDAFGRTPVPMTFEQLELSLHDLARPSVRSAICSMIYEGLLTFEEDLPLSRRTLLTWRASA